MAKGVQIKRARGRPVSFRTLAKNEYSRLGDVRYPPTQDLIAIHGWLIKKPGTTDINLQEATDVANQFLAKRREYLLQELAIADDALGTPPSESIEPQKPQGSERQQQSLETQFTPAIQWNGAAFLSPREALLMLEEAIGNKDLANRGWHALKRYMVEKRGLERFIGETRGYEPIDVNQISKILSISPPDDVIPIVGCFPGGEIKEIVRRVNPYLRYQQQIYVIKEGADLTGVISKLEIIAKSLRQGNLSMHAVEQILRERKLHADASYFDIARDSLFKRGQDGTYEPESVNTFQARTKGYRFVKFRNLLGRNLSESHTLLEALDRYHGDLVVAFVANPELTDSQDAPERFYLFRQNDLGYVDVPVLGKALHIEFHPSFHEGVKGPP